MKRMDPSFVTEKKGKQWLLHPHASQTQSNVDGKGPMDISSPICSELDYPTQGQL